MSAPVTGGGELRVRDLGVLLQRPGGPVAITTGVDLDVAPGEAVALVGESGSGKSLTTRAVLDLLPGGMRAAGRIGYGGRELAGLGGRRRHRLRGRELALVMQDPFTMLNPIERCGAQIVEPLRDGRGRRPPAAERRAEAVRRLAEVGIDDPAVADRYPFELSGGMRQRVAIAAAVAERPRLLIADEPTTALDVTTQKQILDLLGELRVRHSMGLVLITHDLRVAFSVCDRVHVMYAGTVLESARSRDLEERPRHPYTLGLLRAEPPADRRLDELAGIPGAVPAPGERPDGCPFAPRCDWRTDACESGLPPLLDLADGHAARCVRAGEIGDELAALRRAALEEGAADGAAVDGEAVAPDAAPLAVLRDVRKVFPPPRRGGTATTALDGVTVQIAEGESVGLVGESGSGKTTIGRIAVGLERPGSGTVTVGGVTVGARMAKADLARLRGIAQMAFQDPYSSLNPALTIGRTLREAARLGGGRGGAAPPAAELLELVGLPAHYARRRPAGLSGGERQRVAIARALARRPRLLVCDEVVSALDVSVQAQILTLLRDLRAELGLAYLFITHDLAVVRQITDRVYVLRKGEVVESGPTASVLDDPRRPYTRELIASIPHRGPADPGGADDPR